MIKISLVTNNPKVVDIVSETMTVREFLDKHNVNYSVGKTSIDGVTLGVGELDKTFAQYNLGERATVSCLANKDNAAVKAVVMGSSCVITSSLTPGQIKRIKKFHPEALVMQDENDEPVFAIDIDENGPGSINNNGACFGNAVSAEGKATITILTDPTSDNPEEIVYEKIGSALMYLDTMEHELLELIPRLDQEERNIRQMIMKM